MNDLNDLIEEIQSELVNPAEDAFIRRQIGNFLASIRDERFAFSDAEGTFETVDGQIEYEPGEGGVPGNIRQVLGLRYLYGDKYYPIESCTIQEFRRLQSASTVNATRPDRYCWWANKILIDPPCGDAVTLSVDYVIDATLDAESGEEYTSDPSLTDGDFTNEFFLPGNRGLATSYVLIRWGYGRGRDPDLSAQQTIVYNKTLEDMRKEQALKTIGVAVTPFSW